MVFLWEFINGRITHLFFSHYENIFQRQKVSVFGGDVAETAQEGSSDSSQLLSGLPDSM